jgi:V8-like Glu-specific endopeptidase
MISYRRKFCNAVYSKGRGYKVLLWLLSFHCICFVPSSYSTDLIVEDKAIYALDGRYEVIETPALLRQVAHSVGAIVVSRNLSQTDADRWVLSLGSTGRDKGWCETERFIDQPTAASCTGFLLSPDRFATSAHCVQPLDDPGAPGLACPNVSVVFGYALDETGQVTTEFSNNQVYRCETVLAGESDPTGSDWRVLELDREVQHIDALTVYQGEAISSAWELAIIGHPNGLPAKVGMDARVLDASPGSYFVTDIDSYVGNSGSPVFTEHQGQPVVVGLLSRGADDFEQVSNGAESCLQSRQCTVESCGGEHVTPAHVLEDFASSTVRDITAN